MRKGCLAIVLCCALGLPAAHAIVEYRSVSDLTVQADKIIIGDVGSVDSFWENGLIRSRVTVLVSDYILGSGTGVEEFVLSGGTVDDVSMQVSVLPRFENGDHVLLFLSSNSEIGLVEAFQGAYVSDGELIARMAPGCCRIIEDSLTTLPEFLAEIQSALPQGKTFDVPQPYNGPYELPYNLRFGLCGYSWAYKAAPMGENYVINANCADSQAGTATEQRTQIQNGPAQWNAAGADFAFSYGGTSTQTSVTYNNVNLVYFDTTPPDSGSYIAATYIWATGGNITECDLVFNDRDYTWWNGTGTCAGYMDIWNISSHEFGHFLCLADLYSGSDSAKTMYGYGSNCDLHARDLHSDDINGIIGIYGGGAPPYCLASSSSTQYEHITNVTVGTINNSSGSDGYADYSALSTNMGLGDSYPITVTIDSQYATDIGGLWIDWNSDDDFDDTDETITTAWSGAGPTYATTINVPVGATLGQTLMRVRIQDSNVDPTLSPCGDTDYGEVEDYSIVVIAPVDDDPPLPDPMTFSTPPYGLTTTSISMTATTASDATPPVSYQFEFVSGGTGGTDRFWGSQVYTDTGLQVNTLYTYRCRARDSMDTPNVTAYSADATAATLAATPGTIVLSNPTANSMDLNPDLAGNPSYTEMAIQCSYTDPTDANWEGKWVTLSGTPASSEDWQTDASWGTTTVTGLQPSTTYQFRTKARNLDGIETSFGATGSLATSAGSSFNVGDLNCDGVIDLFDIDPFVLALTSATHDPAFDDYNAAYPACDPLLADINDDGGVDLFDIDPFVALLTGP